jgi:hypothetical protein
MIVGSVLPRTLGEALSQAARSAQVIRVTAIGDAAAVPHEAEPTIEASAAAGLAIVGYSHRWRETEAQPWRRALRASVEGFAAATEAIDLGWRPAIVADVADTAGVTHGIRWRVCPEQTGARVNCNSCQLCRTDRNTAIVFRPHGIHAASVRRQLRRIDEAQITG